MYLELITVTSLDKSVTSIFMIAMILLVRKKFNLNSNKYANIVLWSILFAYLIIPLNLLLVIDKKNMTGIGQSIFALADSFVYYYDGVIYTLGSVLYTRNRVIVALLLVPYVIYQIVKMTRAVKNSGPIEYDDTMKQCMGLFNIKRKLKIMLNDDIKVPITYGIIEPKIILQTRILADKKLLKYVLIHELTHISKYDIIWSHLKYVVACIYWYNPFVFVTLKYVEDDIEILCDKLVLKKLGITKEHKKEYLESMLKLVEVEDEKNGNISLKLHPTLDRAKILTKYHEKLSGSIVLILVVLLSLLSFTNVWTHDENTVVVDGEPVQYQPVLTSKVEQITNATYDKLNLGVIEPLIQKDVEQYCENVKLEEFGHKGYKLDTSRFMDKSHDDIAIKISDLKSKSDIEYEIIILEQENVIYRDMFYDKVELLVRAEKNSRYEIILRNSSSKSLKYSININSCTKK